MRTYLDVYLSSFFDGVRKVAEETSLPGYSGGGKGPGIKVQSPEQITSRIADQAKKRKEQRINPSDVAEAGKRLFSGGPEVKQKPFDPKLKVTTGNAGARG